MNTRTPILVSACLLGLNTRYDGKTKQCPAVCRYIEQHKLLPVPICPEQLGGMTTPRCASFFSFGDGKTTLIGDGKLQNEQGQEVTAHFINGAQQSLQIAKLTGCTTAILKQRSPSCGVNYVYLGTKKIAGQGVTTALLTQHGINVISEDDIQS
ncbi:MAG: hypothetical protein B6I36_08130 [Desulfobacteraceae bacterium 4572_35.1]|nr:MAG: hypothetical protein B6I36_08130 [Desulfobacteraceae bacterium 4572_35.1]